MPKLIELEELEDEELIDKHMSTNPRQVFSIIYDRYQPLIFLKCISILKEEAKAKDLTHDIFIKIFTNISQFKGRAKFSLWVHTISVNACLGHLRQKKIDLFSKVVDEQCDGPDEDIEHRMLDEMKFTQLERIMQELPKDHRLLLIMKYVDGLGIKEIGEILRIGDSAVKMRLKRIRNLMLEKFNKENEEEHHY